MNESTYRAVLEILLDDVDRAGRLLCQRRVAKAILLEENGAVPKQISHELRVLERGDRVGLESTVS